jgi:ectoine hydroxylase-related dioxygenase (phytanoyl-CoA dioxygenase family)
MRPFLAPNPDWTMPFAGGVDARGWAVTGPVVPPADLAALAGDPALAAADARGGVRNLLDLPVVRALARSAPVRAAAEAVLGPGCFAVRGLMFDKRAAANWKVPWHQDLTVAVRERLGVAGFDLWSFKAGVAHAQATVGLLERMLAVRVHLDDCGPDNGPLRLIPASHRSGHLSAAEIEAWRERHAADVGLAASGAILGFRPLLLHASGPAAAPGPRRVVHLEFAADRLPGGLQWRWTV